MKTFFGDIGFITIKSDEKVVEYRVTKIGDLLSIIIPHFDKFPLQSVKKIDYGLWKQCILLMANKEHLTQAGLEKIVSIKGAINLGLPDTLKVAFPKVVSIIRPDYSPSVESLDPQWITGFTDGDGCFSVSISSSGQIKAVFSIGLNEREQLLLIQIQSFFGTGNINLTAGNRAVYYQINSNALLYSIIINHFDSYPLVGAKQFHYLIWREVVSLMNARVHRTTEGKLIIKSLVEKLNK
jgi:hypothetical protein